MTTRHSWRRWNTLYMYEVDLVGVWRGLEVPIISYSMSPVRIPLKFLRPISPSPPLWEWCMVWCCGIMTANHGWRLLNTFYRYEVNLVWVWSGWEVPIISYIMSPVRNQDKILHPTTGPPPFGVMVWCCGIMTASHGRRLLNTFYRYEVNLVWVWSGS